MKTSGRCHGEMTRTKGKNIGGERLLLAVPHPLQMLEARRTVWPDDKPIGYRVSATHCIDGGWAVAETVPFATQLDALGCDVIDAPSGERRRASMQHHSGRLDRGPFVITDYHRRADINTDCQQHENRKAELDRQ